jgi:diguanylate cyclase (GGDEF)-like protein
MHTLDYLFLLKSKVRRATTPLENAYALADLAFAELRIGERELAEAKLAELAKLGKHPPNAEIEALHMQLLGVFDFYGGRTAASVTTLLNAHQLAQVAGASIVEARALAALCTSLTMMGAHADAFESADQALIIGDAVGDDRAIAIARISLAYLYIDRGDGHAALAQLEALGPALTRLNDPVTISACSACRVGALIVNARVLMRDPTDENRKIVLQAFKLCEGVVKSVDESQHIKVRVYSWGNLAQLYQILGETDMALTTINHTIALCAQEKTADSMAESYYAKASTLLELGRYPEAADALDQARESAMIANYLAVQESVSAASVTCFEKMGNIAAALGASKEHARLLGLQRTSERANLDTLRKAKREFAEAKREATVAREHVEAMGKVQAQLIEDTQKFKQISFEDALTGLKNRRYFDYRFPELIDHHSRVNTSLSMAIIDIDAFKSINDRFGHVIGDAVLQAVASTLLIHKRVTDEVCRLGGDEFVLFMPNAHLNNARAICEEVRKQFSACKVGSEYGVSLSIGIAEWASSEDHTAFLTRADQKLFVAKREGRNRVAA